MIAFSCPCGQKFKVKPEHAGKWTKCPACKQPLLVPALEVTQVYVPQGAIDGTPSSLHREAGVQSDVTLAPRDTNMKPGQKPVQELLAQRGKGQRYVIEKEIARGGMGAVLRAVDCDIRREIAVKYLLNPNDAKAKARFLEEAQITGQLEHPNIPPVHEVGVDAQGRLYMAMKMVKGRTLGQVLEQHRTAPGATEKEWPLSRLLNLVVNICNGLAYAHARGVVHRDLKPANVMVGDFGEVYVMDWGLAKVLKSRDREGAEGLVASGGRQPPVEPRVAETQTGGLRPPLAKSSKVDVKRDNDIDMTQDGAVLGTPVYMPPEQAMGKIADIDQRSDIYSLGAILYELLTLVPPVDKEGGYLSVLVRVSEGEIQAPEQRVPQRANRIPKELSAIAMKALAKEQKDRYPSADAFRKDIERFLEGRSVSAKEDTKREMIWKFVKRNKGFSGGMAAALLVLVCSLFFVGKAYVGTSLANAALQDEKKDKQAAMDQAVPALVKAARLELESRRTKEARDNLQVALKFEAKSAEARLLLGQVFIAEKQFDKGRAELERYVQLGHGAKQIRQLMDLCVRPKPDEIGNLMAIALIFEQQGVPALADALLTKHGRSSAEVRQKLLKMYGDRIDKAWPGSGACLALDGAGIYSLNLHLNKSNRDLRSLAPLAGMPLTSLNLDNVAKGLSDLSPLKGMLLTSLNLHDCGQVRDLSPLKGMPLTSLILVNCVQVWDLSPLKDMPLTNLNLVGCGQVRDFSPLKGMPLTSLSLHGCGQVRDLAPLKGMPLAWLSLEHCGQVRDLSPLKGMPLTSLSLGGCDQVQDFSPLKGMPLTSLSLGGCGQVRDLSPLKNMPLTILHLGACGQVRDLSPLKDMPLTSLNLHGCDQVRDLSPLKDMPLTSLNLGGCNQARDLSPLQGMKLSYILLPPQVDKGMDVLRRMKTLGKIHASPTDFPAADFWKQYDAGKYPQYKD